MTTADTITDMSDRLAAPVADRAELTEIIRALDTMFDPSVSPADLCDQIAKFKELRLRFAHTYGRPCTEDEVTQWLEARAALLGWPAPDFYPDEAGRWAAIVAVELTAVVLPVDFTWLLSFSPLTNWVTRNLSGTHVRALLMARSAAFKHPALAAYAATPATALMFDSTGASLLTGTMDDVTASDLYCAVVAVADDLAAVPPRVLQVAAELLTEQPASSYHDVFAVAYQLTPEPARPVS
jgi:hypothetical protein